VSDSYATTEMVKTSFLPKNSTKQSKSFEFCFVLFCAHKEMSSLKFALNKPVPSKIFSIKLSEVFY